MQDVAMLAVDTQRSRAYLQYLLRAGLTPAAVVLMERSGPFAGQRNDSTTQLAGAADYFDPRLSIAELVERAGVPCTRVTADDPNDAAVCEAVSAHAQPVFVYSGPGGAILKAPLFATGKRFLHVHSGSLPGFRGSTTMYYELLATGKCAATALFLEPAIDEGPVLHARSFPLPIGIDIDYIYDSHCRATVLVEVLQNYVANGHFDEQPQPPSNDAPYYIMHPALRRLALLKCRLAADSAQPLADLSRLATSIAIH